MKTAEEILKQFMDGDRTKVSIIKSMHEYADQFKPKFPTDEEIRYKALTIVGFDKTQQQTFTQEMAVNHITIFAKWLKSKLQ